MLTSTCRRCGKEYTGDDWCPVCGLAHRPVPCARHRMILADGCCVICGVPVCEECRGQPVDRRVHLCGIHGSVFVISGWAEVPGGGNEVEARLIRDALRAEGIDARVFSQKDLMFSVGVGDLNVVRVLVPAWEYERAMRFIQEEPDVDEAG